MWSVSLFSLKHTLYGKIANITWSVYQYIKGGNCVRLFKNQVIVYLPYSIFLLLYLMFITLKKYIEDHHTNKTTKLPFLRGLDLH